MPSVAVVIIGNEILNGKFPDENGPYLIRRLRALGADLRHLSVIPDVVERIADEVRRCAASHDLVITTGGVGPTHDDVTVEAVAQAFGLELELSSVLAELMARYDIRLDDTTRRMATVPRGSELVTTHASSYPVLRVRNVYVFPGVPRLMQTKFEALADRFAGGAVHTARIYSAEREAEIAATLGEVQARHPTVEIGSYPRFGEGDYKVIVTLESRDAAALHTAHAELRDRLGIRDGGPAR